MFGRSRPKRQVVVYTRESCHLCHEALAVVERHRRRFNLEIRTVNIDGDPSLVELWGDRVPVVEVDGRPRFFGEVDPVLLRRLLG